MFENEALDAVQDEPSYEDDLQHDESYLPSCSSKGPSHKREVKVGTSMDWTALLTLLEIRKYLLLLPEIKCHRQFYPAFIIYFY